MKVKALRKIYFKDLVLEKGKVYDLPEKDVKALGEDVEVVEEEKTKEEKAKKDKMVKEAKTK